MEPKKFRVQHTADSDGPSFWFVSAESKESAEEMFYEHFGLLGWHILRTCEVADDMWDFED